VSEETFWRVVAIFTIVAAGLAGALWKHISEDAKVREETAREIAKVAERAAHLETDNESTKDEVRGLRDRLHDFRDSLPQRVKELVEWFKGK
jgi:hypothetical protein